MIAQGNPMPVPYGEMLVGSRRISQDISTRDEGGAERSWLSGGRGKRIKNPAVIADRNCGRVTKIKCKELFLYHDKKLTQRNYTRHSQFVKM